jgi:hypothetical protein
MIICKPAANIRNKLDKNFKDYLLSSFSSQIVSGTSVFFFTWKSGRGIPEVFHVTGCCTITMTKTVNNLESLNPWAF